MTSLPALLARNPLLDHEHILKAANEALRNDKLDPVAQHARVVALLKLDRYDDALRAIEDGGDALKRTAVLEYAYSLYKSGKYRSAGVVAATGELSSRRMKHMEAQVVYRLENFARARTLYDDLTTSEDDFDGEKHDLRINSGAVDAQLSWSGRRDLAKRVSAGREDLEHFETAFNAACAYLAVNEPRQALTMLSRAKDLCDASEDLTDQERRVELLSIVAQQVYTLLRLGLADDAESKGLSFHGQETFDSATRHIAETNALQMPSCPRNPYQAHRLYHESTELREPDAAFTFQSSLLDTNSLVLDLGVGKSLPASKSSLTCRKPVDAEAPNAASAGLFMGATLARKWAPNSAVRDLVALAERHPTNVGIVMTAVHLCVLNKNVHTSCALVEKYLAELANSSSQAHRDACHKPGLVALQATLHTRLSQSQHSKRDLDRAASFWLENSKSGHGLDSLFAALGKATLTYPSAGERDLTRKVFEFLDRQRQIGTTTATIDAGLAAASHDGLGAHDRNRLSGRLVALERVTKGIDTTSLENTGIAKSAQSPAFDVTNKRRRVNTSSEGTRSRESRPVSTPSDFDPNKKADPERWLPLRDRSNWRPKGKKRGRVGVGAMTTQGGMVSEDNRPGVSLTSQPSKPGGQSKKKKVKR